MGRYMIDTVNLPTLKDNIQWVSSVKKKKNKQVTIFDLFENTKLLFLSECFVAWLLLKPWLVVLGLGYQNVLIKNREI